MLPLQMLLLVRPCSWMWLLRLPSLLTLRFFAAGRVELALLPQTPLRASVGGTPKPGPPSSLSPWRRGGRPSDEAAAFVRLMGSVYTETHGSEDGETAPSPVGRLWQELSTLLQRGNAELILSAIGR